MKYILTSIFLLFVSLYSDAQVNRCGSDVYNRRMKSQNSEFETRSIQIEQQISDYIAGKIPSGSRSVITIPIVFHIVYKVNLQNISDAQVLSQLAVLNEDFRLMNQNFESHTPEVFKPFAADIEIEFCLAQTDPQGNPTTGITRSQTSVAIFSNQNDKIKFSDQGGVDAWPRDRYLNIWICDLESPLLGFAQFPGGSAATDGVVLHYKTIGKAPINPYAAPYNLGSTGTHEVGHWLNLFHIWGNEDSGCEDSDLVSDTPNQDRSNSGCPTFPSISCNNGPNGDMYVNYMDYTDDICHTLFTKGQKQRMRAMFAVGGFRASLLASTACFSGVEPESVCADTLRYPFGGTYTIYNVATPGSGFVSGTNSNHDLAKAELFSASGQYRQLKGAWFDFAVAQQGSAPVGTQIQFKVWSNTGTSQSPSQVLASSSVALSQIIDDVSNHRSTQIIFNEAISFGNGFFIGFEMNQNAGYQLALYTSEDGQSNPGTAWEQRENGSWVPYSEENGWGIQVSHAIFPFIEVPDLQAKFSINDSSICVGNGVIFQALDHASFYHWSFPGGIPEQADTVTPFVQYAAKGIYPIELRVASPCFSDTVSVVYENVVEVNAYPPTPFVEYDGEKMISTVTNGAFKWYRNNNLVIGASEYFYKPLQNGIYKVVVTQSGCSSTSAPFDIEGVGFESVDAENVLIYPNPSSGLFWIKHKAASKQLIGAFSVYDVGGKLLFSKESIRNSETNEEFLDLRFLESGVYFVKYDTPAALVSQRLVIMR